MNNILSKSSSRLSLWTALCISMLYIQAVNAQQSIEFNNGYPVAPTGLENKPLGDGPFYYPTAEGMDIKVVVVSKGLVAPTSMAFISDSQMLVTTRPGEIRLIENGILNPNPVAGGPASVFSGRSGSAGARHGYVDLILHPEFDQNGFLYLSYNKPAADNGVALTVGRGRWSGEELLNFSEIWSGGPDTNGPGRIVFDQAGKLYITISGTNPQDLSTLGGTVARLNDDGSIPVDNPFIGQDNARPEIFTYGHRNALGIAIHPASGEVWQNENGPNGGDEINVLIAGANYGWPIVSLGRTYQGPWQSGSPDHSGFEPPVVYWMPAIAVSGMAFYTGDALPKWKGDVFVGALRTGEIPGTGHIERIMFNENMDEIRRETLLVDLGQRIRDIRQGPDGFIYIATDEEHGAILRIEPAQ